MAKTDTGLKVTTTELNCSPLTFKALFNLTMYKKSNTSLHEIAHVIDKLKITKSHGMTEFLCLSSQLLNIGIMLYTEAEEYMSHFLFLRKQFVNEILSPEKFAENTAG